MPLARILLGLGLLFATARAGGPAGSLGEAEALKARAAPEDAAAWSLVHDAFAEALGQGADPLRVWLELALADLQRGRVDEAATHLYELRRVALAISEGQGISEGRRLEARGRLEKADHALLALSCDPEAPSCEVGGASRTLVAPSPRGLPAEASSPALEPAPRGRARRPGYDTHLARAWAARKVAVERKDRESWEKAYGLFVEAADQGSDPVTCALEAGYAALEVRAFETDDALSAADLKAAADHFRAARRAAATVAGDPDASAEQRALAESRMKTVEAQLLGMGYLEESPSANASEQAWRAMARAYLLRKRAVEEKTLVAFDEARAAFASALAEGAEPMEVWMEVGNLHASQGRPTEASDAMLQALRASEKRLLSDATDAATWARAREIRTSAARYLRAVAPSAASEGHAASGAPANHSLHLAARARTLGQDDAAAGYLTRALEEGADAETVEVELGYLALLDQDADRALWRFGRADRSMRAAQARARALEVVGGGSNPERPPGAVSGRRLDLETAGSWTASGLERKAECLASPSETLCGEALSAFTAALMLGAEPQPLLLEMGYVELALKRREQAARRLLQVVGIAEELARVGSVKPLTTAKALELGALARKELDALEVKGMPPEGSSLGALIEENSRRWLREARARAAVADGDGARAALDAARVWGLDREVIHVERGYLAMAEGRADEALTAFSLAADEALARGEARPSLDHLRGGARYPDLPLLPATYAAVDPSLPTADYTSFDLSLHEAPESTWARVNAATWVEVFFQAYGWWRFHPCDRADLVPLLMGRLYWRPWESIDLDPYLYAHISRDLASRARGPLGFPVVYADNSAGAGAGVLYRTWRNRVGMLAQVGPALNLLGDEALLPDRARVELDLRAGAWLKIERKQCVPQPSAEGATTPMSGCYELYGETFLFSRPEANAVAQIRGRVGLTAWVTGRVAWQPLLEARAFKDVRGDFWNNLVEASVGHRWRLLPAPPHTDLGIYFTRGSYFGIENEDPAPSILDYSELRLLAETGMVF
jgi:hypothetical protein